MAADDAMETDATRRARIHTEHADPALVAAAVAADNTDEMATRVEDGTVVTTIERPTTGGLRSTVDDYVVNLAVADRSARIAAEHAAATGRADGTATRANRTDDTANDTANHTTDDTNTETDDT